MHIRFEANDYHTVDVLFMENRCAVMVMDSRVVEIYQKEVPLPTYDKLVTFIKENDHTSAICEASRLF